MEVLGKGLEVGLVDLVLEEGLVAERLQMPDILEDQTTSVHI